VSFKSNEKHHGPLAPGPTINDAMGTKRADWIATTVPLNDHDTRFSRLRDGGKLLESTVLCGRGRTLSRTSKASRYKSIGGRPLGTGVLWLAWVPQEDRASDEHPPRIDEYHCIGPRYVYCPVLSSRHPAQPTCGHGVHRINVKL
jgi:NAD dependent epimerase/dehydratase family enzyme